MPKKQPDALGQQYRDAKAALSEHRHRAVAVDLERLAWLRAHRGVPSHLLYDRQTGDPLDPELVDLEARLTKATADVEWCKALLLACGELVKGEPLAGVLARNEAHRPKIIAARARIGTA